MILELLYGRDPVNERKSAITIKPQDKATNFRWIHLPANNMAWVEALLTKTFIEEGASDVEGFKALERSFSHQHRGQQVHSHFMRPLSQSTPRAQWVSEDEPNEHSTEQAPPTIVINDGPESHPKTPVRGFSSSEDGKDWFNSSPQHSGKDIKGKHKEKGKKSDTKGNRSPKSGSETPNQNRTLRHPDGPHSRSPGSPGRKDVQNPKGNIFTFMPYLHFETNSRRQEMQEAIKRAEDMQYVYSSSCFLPPLQHFPIDKIDYFK